MRRCRSWMAILLCACGMLLPGLAPAQPAGGEADRLVPVERRTPEGIPYLTGGAGVGEREELSARSGDYNVKLIFALREGKYLALINVVISGADGSTVLETTTQGPWLFTRLPRGSYKVRATMGSETITREFEAKESGTAEVQFLW